MGRDKSTKRILAKNNEKDENDEGKLDSGDWKPVGNSSNRSNTQKKMGRKKSTKRTSASDNEKDESDERELDSDDWKPVGNSSNISNTQKKMGRDKSTKRISAKYNEKDENASPVMRDKNLRMNDETRLSPNDKVHDMPCLPLQKLQGHAGDMKAEFDQTAPVSDLKQILLLTDSVGLIRSSSACGTGFHVGPGFIMTAKHVIDAILNGALVPLGQEKQIFLLHQLSSQNVFIDFSDERNGQTNDESRTFYFEPVIEYVNGHLDTVILKLKKDPNKKFPRHLTKFSQLPNDLRHGYLIGHPEAGKKLMDQYKPYLLEPQILNDARIWSLEHAKVDGFSGIDDPCRILLHCTFGKGASGSPGFYISPNDGKAHVVFMLLRGYPDWYYDDKFSQEIKKGIKSNYLIEQGVSMAAIYEDMKKQKPALQKKIFPDNDEDEEMEE